MPSISVILFLIGSGLSIVSPSGPHEP